MTKSTLRLEIGDPVVYGRLGIGRILSRTPAARGNTTETVVVGFGEGLSITLPIDQAVERLRPPAGEAEIASVARALRSVEKIEDVSWRTRNQAAEEKLSSGEPIGLAEIIRDAARLEQQPGARGQTKPLSTSNRRLYLEARQLLAAQIGAYRGTDTSTADAWITEQLTHDAEPEKIER